MKTIIPYNKKIEFKSKIKEILSISLEHKFDVIDDCVNGVFIVSGEYKSHELSVNKESFSEELSFNFDNISDLDKNSINVEIDDFTYDILNDDVLDVNIDYVITGEEKAEEPEEIIIPEIVEERAVEEEKTEIINDINLNEEKYTTYHIHIIRENDSLEKICDLYKTNTEIIKEYNQVDTLELGMKLIIPELLDE